MQYLLMIYGDETADGGTNEESLAAMMDEYWAYTEAMRAAGVNKGGEALHPTSAATTVRVRDGQTLTTHGPFAETAEQLGGYYLIDAENLDQAIEWAAKCPGARTGSIELRPIMDFSQAG
jgi:hypothetical protein